MISNINTAGRYIVVNKYREEHGENATVSLSPEAELIFQWATIKMAAEQRWAELAKEYPAVADAVENLKRAREQLEVVVELVK
jgi:hypothetical protein